MRSAWGDWEGELVVAIGPGGKDIAEADAWNHVAGFCVGQDISDRAVQSIGVPPQFNMGKSFDTFGPIGPMLVSRDELPKNLGMKLVTKVNGKVQQEATTDDLIFDVPKLISYLSHITTLQTGDLIFTGTPGGIGLAQNIFLKDGDVVETMIEGIGVLENRCVRVADHPQADQMPDFLRDFLKTHFPEA